MNTALKFAVVALMASMIMGCATRGPYAHTRQGAVIGSALGGITGAIVGHQNGQGLEGAAVGAGIGALAGATWGSSMDEPAYPPPQYWVEVAPPRQYWVRVPPPPRPRPIRMHRKPVPLPRRIWWFLY